MKIALICTWNRLHECKFSHKNVHTAWNLENWILHTFVISPAWFDSEISDNSSFEDSSETNVNSSWSREEEKAKRSDYGLEMYLLQQGSNRSSSFIFALCFVFSRKRFWISIFNQVWTERDLREIRFGLCHFRWAFAASEFKLVLAQVGGRNGKLTLIFKHYN